jgi:hypothetical protein
MSSILVPVRLSVQQLTFRIDPWGKSGLGLLVDLLYVVIFIHVECCIFPVDAEVLILLMDYSDLSVVQRKGLSVNQILKHLELGQQVVVKQKSIDVYLV